MANPLTFDTNDSLINEVMIDDFPTPSGLDQLIVRSVTWGIYGL